MAKVLLILLGEWRNFGQILYEKLTYVLSILPGLSKGFCYGIRLLVKFFMKCFYGLRVEVSKGGVKVKVRLNIWKKVVLYLDQRDKELYRKACFEELEKRKRKLRKLKGRVDQFNGWLEKKFSRDFSGIRMFLKKIEKKVNKKRYVEIDTTSGTRMVYRIVERWENLRRFGVGFLRRTLREMVCLFKFEALEKEKKNRVFKLVEKIGIFGNRFIDFLRGQDVPMEIRIFLLEKHLIPEIRKKIEKIKKIVEFLGNFFVIKEPEFVKRFGKRLLEIEEEKVKIEVPTIRFKLRIMPWLKIQPFSEKIPVFRFKKKFFYKYYQKKERELENWWRNKKKERAEVLNLKLMHSDLEFGYKVEFFLGESKEVEEWEDYWDNSIWCTIFHTMTRYVKKVYCFIVMIVASDPFVYAWNVFFLVTGIYMLLIIGPIVLFFELIRIKK